MTATRGPWWGWTPYALADIEGYLTNVQRHCATKPDPARVLPARLVRVDLPAPPALGDLFNQETQ